MFSFSLAVAANNEKIPSDESFSRTILRDPSKAHAVFSWERHLV